MIITLTVVAAFNFTLLCRNHSLGFTWWHPNDPYGSSCDMPSGKGERIVMLTGICKEYGIPSLLNEDGSVNDELKALMLFKAKKATGDYHSQMNSDAFCEWLQDYLFPCLASRNIKAILVLDNASYHCCAAEGSINVDQFMSKKKITEVFDQYGIPYRGGRANRRNPEAGGDSLDTMKASLRVWLRENADREGIIVNKMKIDLLCDASGHFPPLWTPPYHPELQPIEHLWRDVKMYVARKYVGGRSMTELVEQVKEAFLMYGKAEWVSKKLVAESLKWEVEYKTKGYTGDDVPPSWDDYTTQEDQDFEDEASEGTSDDIEEEDGDDEDGFAVVDVGDE